ncbi:PQQ-binding-like beta-propeller repeat protein [Kitasatospora sp. NPDC056446]|uniref:caspase, EACC1-associated type n=1 Tax=Kitasatospora sp. NPDC056446 TaxID=3345819 RepID=UPI0036B909C8
MTGIDFARSTAILVGTSHYTHGLAEMRAARNSLRAMWELLTGPLCGWPASRVVVLEDLSTRDGPYERIAALIHSTTDVLVFHYVGHGQLLDGEHLGMALVDTHADPKMRYATSLRLNDLREELERRCRARVKVLILDCCFSGLATGNTQGAGLADQVRLVTKVAGAYTLTASRASQKAIFEEGRGGLTYFTKIFTEVVRAGIVGAGPELTLKAIHREVAARFLSLDLPDRHLRPEPSALVVDTADELAFARNAVDTGALPAAERTAVPVEHGALPVGTGHRLASWLVARRRSAAVGIRRGSRTVVGRRALMVGGALTLGAAGAAIALPELGLGTNSDPSTSEGGKAGLLDAPDAARAWTTSLDATGNSVALVDGLLVSISHAGVMAFDHLGKAKWGPLPLTNSSVPDSVAGDGHGMLYVTGQVNWNWVLAAIDTSAGQVAWTIPLPHPNDWTPDGVLGPLGGMAYVTGLGSKGPGVTAKHIVDSFVWAVDIANRRGAWELYDDKVGVVVVPTTGGRLLVGAADDDFDGGRVQAVDAAKGERGWTMPVPIGALMLGLSGSARTACAAGGLFVLAANLLYALDAETGKQVWVLPPGASASWGYPSASPDGGTVYITDATTLYALDSRTGSVRWKTASTTSLDPATAPQHIGDTVYVRDKGSYLWAVNSANGAARWKALFPVGAPSESIAVTGTGGRIYVRHGQKLIAINETGR